MVGAISYTPLVRIYLGPLSLSPHGLFTAVGFMVGAHFLLKDTAHRGIADEVVFALLARAAIGALIGARMFYVVNHLSNYDSPLEWFAVWRGGISLLGGIAGALIAASPQMRRRGLRFFQMMDLAAPWLALGVAVGRVGDLIIADHLGAPTTFAFGFRCPHIVDVGRTVGSPCPPDQVVHLTAAYDLIIALALFAFLVTWRHRARWEGQVTLLLATLYGVGRFLFDFLREDKRRAGLTASQWTALVLVVVGTSWLIRRRGSVPPEPATTGVEPVSDPGET